MVVGEQIVLNSALRAQAGSELSSDPPSPMPLGPRVMLMHTRDRREGWEPARQSRVEQRTFVLGGGVLRGSLSGVGEAGLWDRPGMGGRKGATAALCPAEQCLLSEYEKSLQFDECCLSVMLAEWEANPLICPVCVR